MTIDSTLGRETFFVATWQAAKPPEINLVDPNRKSYTSKDFVSDLVFHVARLQIPGIAEVQLTVFFCLLTILFFNILTLHCLDSNKVMLRKII